MALSRTVPALSGPLAWAPMTDTTDTSDAGNRLHRIGLTVTALAEDGLAYSTGGFDLARYEQLTELGRELLGIIGNVDPDEIRVSMALDGGYVTPKVDVRAVLFDDADRVLLMKERLDGLWSLPGGWADPGDTPASAAQREMLEEAGHHVRVVKVIGCWDRDMQGHTPKMSVSVVKLFFLCEQTADPEPPSELETLDLGWFSLDDLPELSLSRVTHAQLATSLRHQLDRSLPTEFD